MGPVHGIDQEHQTYLRDGSGAWKPVCGMDPECRVASSGIQVWNLAVAPLIATPPRTAVAAAPPTPLLLQATLWPDNMVVFWIWPVGLLRCAFT